MTETIETEIAILLEEFAQNAVRIEALTGCDLTLGKPVVRPANLDADVVAELDAAEAKHNAMKVRLTNLFEVHNFLKGVAQ